MGQVQIDHGGGDLLVAEQALDRVEMGPGLQQVSADGQNQPGVVESGGMKTSQ